MFLKVMSEQNHLADADQAKNYTMIEIPKGHRLHFTRDESYPLGDPHVLALIGKYAGLEHMEIPVDKEFQSEVVAIPAMAYVLNDDGKTIDRRSSFGTYGVMSRTGDLPSRTYVHIQLDPDDPTPEKTIERITSLVGSFTLVVAGPIGASFEFENKDGWVRFPDRTMVHIQLDPADLNPSDTITWIQDRLKDRLPNDRIHYDTDRGPGTAM